MLDKSISQPLTDEQELLKFDQLAENWWDPKGKFKHVIAFNQARFDCMFNKVIEVFSIDPQTENPLQGLTVLDIGCGGGLLSEAFANCGAKVTGIDGSEISINVARSHAKKMGLDIDYQYCLIEDFSPQQPFDIVINAEVIEHVEQQQALVDCCSQHVASEGLLIFATLTRTWLSYLVAIIGAEYVLKMLPVGTHDWRYFVKPEELSTWLEQCGYSMIESSGINFVPVLNRWFVTSTPKVNYIAFAQLLRN